MLELKQVIKYSGMTEEQGPERFGLAVAVATLFFCRCCFRFSYGWCYSFFSIVVLVSLVVLVVLVVGGVSILLLSWFLETRYLFLFLFWISCIVLLLLGFV